MARVALVTGGTRGIGRAIVERLKADGMQVAAGYSGNDEAAAECAKTLDIMVVKGNVGNFADCKHAVEQIEKQLGPIDVLVNNAGIFPRTPFLELTEETWDAVLDTNLKSTFVCSQEAARRMVAADRPGAIINLSSGAPYRGGTRATAYMASKLGIVGLTRGMARELAPHGIRVNVVAPGVTNTAMPRLGNTEEALAALGRNNPTGRLAEPVDIADVIVFLATDAARYIVGQLIHVNGGDYHG
jgi:acetoacetyl-CoA reductase